MLRKAFKVIGIAVLGAVFALGALAVSVVYIIPGIGIHNTHIVTTASIMLVTPSLCPGEANFTAPYTH